ncbi:EAL domain-containing protein [Paenibacillus doosanensis]|uniref:sensor domain-containing protein n=1 Tax=Paenibacillus doosanensis TaxID=1229154 RepID=UPI00218049C5|nr:EAL domain-containing protein [Paenibacillus doosanensis]MCS7464197.1 EAL domain-containing protein [Paenibacillus doosanensis]
MVDYKHLVEDSIAGMFFIHNEALTFVNNAFISIFGYASVEDFYDNHRTLQDLMPLESYLTLFQQKKQVGSGEKQAHNRYVIECYHRNGHSIYVEVFAKMNRQDQEVTIYGTMIDVSDSIHMQQELYMSEQKYRSLFEYNTNLIYSFDLDGHFDSMNPAVTETLGYSFDELIYMNFEKFIHPDDLAMTLQNFNEAKTYGHHRSYEARIIHKSGQIRHTHIINIPIYIDRQITGVYGIARDITELKNYIEQIERLANYDYLTGLPNRRYFEQKNAEYYNERQPATLALIDLDGFKTINDTLGHDIGDELLKEFSRLLLRVCSSTDLFVSRIGGDEFAVIAPDDAGYPSILRVAEELLERLLKPLHVHEFELYIAASIGICSSSGQETAPMQLFKHADIALYNAKATGKRKISIYSHLNDEVTLKRFTLVRDIQQAIAGRQFYLEYQPRYDIKNQRVTCVEALLRWRHPSWGIVPPGEFIPIAEESGLIVELGKWALQTACREIKPLADALNFNLSVNVSVVQIMNQEFVATIKQILDSEQFDPRRLELEITESALYNSEEKMKYFLDELKDLQIQVSLDDFGAGYSSLSFIQKYAIDTVKLDKTFVNTLTANDRNAKIFSSIVSLLKSLETNVVAEGIETIEHFHFLAKNECDEAQGYLFSRPIPIRQLIEMMLELPDVCKIPPLNRLGVEE